MQRVGLHPNGGSMGSKPSSSAEVKVARTIRQTKKRGVDFLMLGDG